MANTAIPYGPKAPGYWQLGVETTFDTASAAFQRIRVLGEPDISGLHLPVFEDETIRGSFAELPRIPGATGMLPEGTQITLERYMRGYRTSAPGAAANITDAAVDATGYPDALALECLFGGEQADGVVDVTDAQAHTVSKVYGVDLSTAPITEGAGFVVNTNPDIAGVGVTKWEVGFISDFTAGATDLIDTRHPLTQIPDAAGGVPIYGGLTYYPTLAPTKSCSLRFVGALVDGTTPLYATFTGCRLGSVEITGAAGGLVKRTETWSLTSATWTDASAVGASYAADSYPQPEQLVGGRCLLGSIELPLQSFTFRYGNGLAALGSMAHAHGVSQYTKTDQPCGLDIKVRMEETNYQTFVAAYRASTSVACLLYWGSGPGKMVAINIPAARVGTWQAPVSEGGVAYVSGTLYPSEYTGDVGTTGIVDKAVYMFLG